MLAKPQILKNRFGKTLNPKKPKIPKKRRKVYPNSGELKKITAKVNTQRARRVDTGREVHPRSGELKKSKAKVKYKEHEKFTQEERYTQVVGN